MAKLRAAELSAALARTYAPSIALPGGRRCPAEPLQKVKKIDTQIDFDTYF